MDNDFGHWLAGFIDGEGCFSVLSGHRGPSNSRWFRCSFALTLRQDDREILERIYQYTNLGRLEDRPAYARSKPQSTWIISTKSGCASLVDLLDTYPLRAKKAKDFAVWREAVIAWNQNDGDRVIGLGATLKSSRQQTIKQ